MFWDKKEKSMIKSQPAETHYKREIVAVALCALFIFLALAFISYSPHDNSFFHYTNKSRQQSNWAGVVGAQCSALCFFLFGAGAFLVLLSVGALAWLLFKGIELKQERGRIGSLFLVTLSATTLCSTIQGFGVSKISGGFIGAGLSRFLSVAIGRQGSLIFLLSALWIGLLLLTRVPFLPVFKYIGQRSRSSLSACWSLLMHGGSWLWHKIIRKKAQVESPVHEQGVTGGEAGPDFAFLGSVSEAKPCESVDQRWLKMRVRTASEPRRLLKGFVYRFANSVTKKNFLAHENWPGCFQLKPYAGAGHAAYSGKKQQALPDRSFFVLPREQKPIAGMEAEIAARGKLLEEKLLHFGVKGKVTAIKTGPLITLFEYKPEIDSKISKITALEDDLAMALMAVSIRILAPIPGKNVIGFEIANAVRQDVYFSEVLASMQDKTPAALPLVFGVDVAGTPMVQDLVRMPHILVGGSTGSGKSVGLNAMIAGLLTTMTPDKMKMILVDPKRLEFTPYADIPHLIFPIITEPARATAVLKWVCQDMESRYTIMAKAGVRNIQEYHKLFQDGKVPLDREGTALPSMPFMVVVIDELADLMMVAGKEVEMAIVRIAQMARASGIHMIVATQRPSVDVVTGLIKVNFPSRVSFRVSSKVDSRTILDQQGAEKLLGRGDMLYLNANSPDLMRVHGAYVSDKEVHKLATWWREQQKPEYLDLNEVLHVTSDQKSGEYQDDLYKQVLEFIKTNDEISISMIQRYFRIGFNRSARLIEKLEIDGLIAPSQGAKPRKVLR